MNFTRAQKDALWRKIDEVSSVKKKRLMTEFEKNWKPNPKFKDLYDKLKRLDKLRKEEADIQKEITGGEYCKTYDFGDASLCLYGSYSYERTMELYKSQAKENFENKLYADKIIPSKTAVMDELELQLLSKTFDVQAFLAKFGVNELDMNHTYDVVMHELQKDGSVSEIKQTATCPNRDYVIRIYGLDQPDIVSYEITERK